MPPLNVVKIDLCGSKEFARSREQSNPAIRSAALNALLEISKRMFPNSGDAFPGGSFLKADGDAVTYVLEKSSVALRASVEFMQTWFHEGMPQFPECRVFIDRGYVEIVQVPGKTELTGRPFENISTFEKEVEEGKVYLTRDVVDNCDQTMAKFVFHSQHTPRQGETLRVFWVDFLDPRTVSDSSMIHALFVAHPKSSEARERLYELFLAEYLVEKNQISDVSEVTSWGRLKGYPLPTADKLELVLKDSGMVVSELADQKPVYRVKPEVLQQIAEAKAEFRVAQLQCLEDVKTCIIDKTRAEAAIKDVNLEVLIEDYLCAVFSEIRMMANYFRETFHVFEAGPEAFRRFDYILRRHVGTVRPKYLEDWRDGFLWGLKRSSEKDNLYIASVFHNVLATYYLNRSLRASAYQVDRLKKRHIYIDTNVLYAFRVPASNYHELVCYFMDRLKNLGVPVKVFPFTLEEYEHSLELVEKEFHRGRPSAYLVNWNPWLYQEFKRDPDRHLGSMAACRQTFSLAKGKPLKSETLDQIDAELRANGLALEKTFNEYTEEQVQELWIEMRNAMASLRWDLFEYWEFIYGQARRSDAVIKHDVWCIQNASDKSELAGRDDLGPIVVFLTLDSRKLLRLRGKYPFILSPRQFVEFILPYLFLSDIPVVEPDRFPNQLLSAQLGTLLVRRPPELTEKIGAFLSDPSLLDPGRQTSNLKGTDMGLALSNERFREIVEMAPDLGDAQKDEVAERTATIFGELDRIARVEYFQNRGLDERLTDLERRLDKKDEQVEKLQRTVRYWRQQARR